MRILTLMNMLTIDSLHSIRRARGWQLVRVGRYHLRHLVAVFAQVGRQVLRAGWHELHAALASFFPSRPRVCLDGMPRIEELSLRGNLAKREVEHG